jgi:rod shape-determining protein MreC
VTIDRGEADGVRVNDPVINAEGLVGKVTLAASDGAYVSLITDSTVGVSARIGTSGAPGILQPKVGDPSDLLLQYLPSNAPAPHGALVVTSGTVSGSDDSLFPPDIPIGEVTSVNSESAYRSVNVHPLANLHNLDVVQVLTARPGSLPANLSRLVRNLPPGAGAGSSSAETLASVGAGG